MIDTNRIAFARDQLAPALALIGKVRPWRKADKSPGLIHILSTGHEATLISADSEVQIQVTIPCQSDAAVEMLAPLIALAPLVEKQKAGAEVRLTRGDGTVRAVAGRTASTMPASPGDALPVRAPLIGNRQILAAAALREGLTAALPAVVDDTARPYLGGVHVRTTAAGLAFEAQDGARIHAAERADAHIEAGITIPERAARLIAEVLPEDGSAAIVISARGIEVTAGAIRVTAALIDGRFPDVRPMLAMPTDRVLRANAETLLADLDLVCAVSSQRDRDFRLDLGAICEASAFRVTEGVPAMGAVQLDAEFSGAPLAIGFQLHLVRDALRLFGGSVIAWRMAGPTDATVITSDAHPGVEAGISPFRLAPDHIRKAA